MKPGSISSRTIVTAVGLFASVAVVGILGWFGVGGDWLKDVGSTLVNAAAALVVLSVAFSFAPGESYRRPWILIGTGVALYAVGDLTWTIVADVMGKQPYPSVADVFYLAEYAFLSAGILVAAWAYRELVPMTMPAIVAVFVAVATAGSLWMVLLDPYVIGSDAPALSKTFSVIYPLADALLLVGPAVFTALVVSRLGAGRLAWPWWWVVVGTLLLAASDSTWSILDAVGGTTAAVEWGWMAASVCIAVGALFARDVTRV